MKLISPFKDNNASVAVLRTQTAFPSLVPSTSKFLHDFGLTSSLGDMNIKDQVGDEDNQA